MSNQTYDEKFEFLTENEIIVLNAKCNGADFREIARRLGFGVAWAYHQMSIVYRKLGIDETYIRLIKTKC